MKKILALVVALAMVLSLTAAFADGEPVVLKVASIWSAETEANRAPMLKTLAEFEEAHPEIKLEVEWYEANAWKDQGETLALSDSLPDVFYWNAGGVLWNLVSTGDILALNDYLTDDIKDQLIGGALANMTFDGKVYQLPYTNACSCLYCNTELFDKYGVRSPRPWTSCTRLLKPSRPRASPPWLWAAATSGRPTCIPTSSRCGSWAMRPAGPAITRPKAPPSSPTTGRKA